LHELEQMIIDKHWKIDQPLATIQDGLDADVNVLQQWMGARLMAHSSIVSIERIQLTQLRERLKQIPDVRWSKELIEFLNRYLYKSFHEMLNSYPAYVERVARTLDKWIAPLVIEGDLVFVDPERYGGFVRSLVHVFRNMIDHGIDTLEERVLRGKEECGLINCRIARDKKGFQIVISDDGNGMHADQLRNRAIQKGLLNADVADQMSEQACYELIWLDGFSTRDQASELSGRGVGLAAVKEQVLKLGGHVVVETKPEKGTTFQFFFPYL
jgi:chemotaxis protein histidine kinase CheA